VSGSQRERRNRGIEGQENGSIRAAGVRREGGKSQESDLLFPSLGGHSGALLAYGGAKYKRCVCEAELRRKGDVARSPEIEGTKGQSGLG